MIDYLTIQSTLKLNPKTLSPMRWQKRQNEYTKYYLYKHNGVVIKYHPDKELIRIEGKISQLFSASQVLNLDDIFGADTDQFITSINIKLRTLLDIDTIDIRTFKVVRIDYCFNVKTPYVTEYLEFMGAAFQHKNKGRRTDFTNDRGLFGSLYIKPTGEYENNLKKTYCLNFYDKSDWIRNKETQGIYISDSDKELSTDIFRLEVQCYSDKIKRICKKHKFTNRFENFCSLAIAYDTICEVYKTLFGGNETCYYVQYEETKKINFTATIRQQLILSAQHHDITLYSAKEAIRKNIYPYYFLPSKWKISRIENPMKLIQDKINSLPSPL